MIGVWRACAGTYLAVAGVAMLASFGVLLVGAPMTWARLLRWEIPQQRQLAAFLGRSLGLFISLFGLFAVVAARTPQAQPFLFGLMIWPFMAMIGLHLHGAVTRAQPVTETYEIVLWVVPLAITLAFYPA